MFNSDTFGRIFWVDDNNQFRSCPQFIDGTGDFANSDYVSDWQDWDGFSLIREKSHYIWKHSTGAIITTSKTPSGNYALAQCNRQIKKALLV